MYAAAYVRSGPTAASVVKWSMRKIVLVAVLMTEGGQFVNRFKTSCTELTSREVIKSVAYMYDMDRTTANAMLSKNGNPSVLQGASDVGESNGVPHRSVLFTYRMNLLTGRKMEASESNGTMTVSGH
jgi:hypothetical protein